MSRERRILDDTPVVLRHVRRPKAGDAGGTTVLLASYVAAGGSELAALNGVSGWQSGQVESALAGDGTVTLRIPNAQGDDGILHRKRFALLTDPLYRIGEEWIEVYREPMSPDNLLAVMTPSGWRVDRGQIELRGPDLMALYTLARSSELDIWHHAPRDVFDFYTRLPVAELAEAFAWTTIASSPGTVRDLPAGVSSYAWKASSRIRWIAPVPPATGADRVDLEVRLVGGATINLTYRPFDQVAYFVGTGIELPGGTPVVGKANRNLPGDVSLTILLRDRWVTGWVAGELVCWAQLTAAARYVSPDRMTVLREGTTTAELGRMDFESPRRFGLRGADKGSLRLPGSPTSGGLRGSYFNFAHHAASLGTNPSGTWGQYLAAMLSPLEDPVTERLDTVPTFLAQAGGGVPAAGGAPVARWVGSIFLDLSGNGRRLRLNTSTSQVAARIWIGRTERVTDAVIDAWAAGTKLVQTANLRDVLGEGTGWYPIVIEAATLSGIAFSLEESALDASGVATGGWTAVPRTKFSPIGCYIETHRFESHRELLDAIAQAAGYQWRVDPRTLESGEFPGQVIPRIRVGVDTDKIITGEDSTDLASEGDAMDAVDRLLADAAGVADPKGSGQLTAAAVNDVAADAGHLFLSSGAESLPEITEPELLEQRIDSLLTLRASPNEQVGVRPTSLPAEVSDTFPLTGALARRRWRPGDGLRLELDELAVVDLTPRQITALTLPIYRQGLGAPVVGFRQRPRGLRAFLQKHARAAAAARRNYQGTLAVLQGSLGSNPVATALPDIYSRLTVPWDIERVVSLVLVVETQSGTNTIEVNGTNTGIPINAVGRYPLDRWIQREAGVGGSTVARFFVRTLGTGTASYRLEAIVRL